MSENNKSNGFVNVSFHLDNLPTDPEQLDKIHDTLRAQAAELEGSENEDDQKRLRAIIMVHSCISEEAADGRYSSMMPISELDTDVYKSISEMLPGVDLKVEVSKHDAAEVTCDRNIDPEYYNHIDMLFSDGAVREQSLCHYDNNGNKADEDDIQLSIEDDECKSMADFQAKTTEYSRRNLEIAMKKHLEDEHGGPGYQKELEKLPSYSNKTKDRDFSL